MHAERRRLRFRIVSKKDLKTFFRDTVWNELAVLQNISRSFVLFKNKNDFKEITGLNYDIFVSNVSNDMSYNNITFSTFNVLQSYLQNSSSSLLFIYSFDPTTINLYSICPDTNIEFVLTDYQVLLLKSNFKDYLLLHPDVNSLLNFKNRQIFGSKKKRSRAIFMNKLTTPHGDLLFPDGEKLIDEFIHLKQDVYRQTVNEPCPICGALSYVGTTRVKCFCEMCKDTDILRHLPSKPPDELLDIIIQGMSQDKTHNFARNLNANLRGCCFFTSIHSGTPAELTKITGVPYAVPKDYSVGNAYVIADNTNFEAKFNIPTDIVRKAARILLQFNEVLRDYVTEEEIIASKDSKSITSVYIPNNQNSVSLVQLGTSSIQARSVETFKYPHKKSEKLTHISSRSFIYDVLAYPIVFHDGQSGFGKFFD